MMKEVITGVYTYEDSTHNFNFCTSLSAHDKAIFVRTVVDTIVDDENYDSVLKDIIFDYTAISMMTDIDTSFLKINDDNGNVVTDIDMLEDFLLSTNIIDVIEANAFPTLFDELNRAIDKSIAYRTGINPSPLSDALASLVSTIEKKVNEIDLDSMMGMATKLASMTDELNVENIMKAYMESDMHKKNLAEIAESKKDKTEIADNLDKAIKEVNADAKKTRKTKNETTK